MPFQWEIAINKNTQGPLPRVVFDPNPLPASALDQIFWTNNDDSAAHWPGRLRADGTIDQTFFMSNQIAPNGDVSPIFSPSAPATFNYACSLHPDEQGTITVTQSDSGPGDGESLESVPMGDSLGIDLVPFQWPIAINKNTQEPLPRVVFDPNPLQASVLDQIFWTNNDDSEAHWPGLLRDDGTIDQTFFMPNQIAPNGDTSAIFAPSAPATFRYACSLHPEEQGTIIVT